MQQNGRATETKSPGKSNKKPKRSKKGWALTSQDKGKGGVYRDVSELRSAGSGTTKEGQGRAMHRAEARHDGEVRSTNHLIRHTMPAGMGPNFLSSQDKTPAKLQKRGGEKTNPGGEQISSMGIGGRGEPERYE